MRRLLLIAHLLACSVLLKASPTEASDAAQASLAKIDQQIARLGQAGDTEKEGEARWKKMVTLKNNSLTREQAAEADVQMEWFRKNSQWDNYYRTWQLKANALSALGKLQTALQETQRMLADAQKRDNRLGRAMAYKQIGIIYLNMKQTEPAIEALQHYAELMKGEESDFSSLSNIYYRMAKAYDYDKEYARELQVTDEWRRYLHEKVGKVERADVRECYNACYLARGAAFIGLNRLEDAEQALDTARHQAHLTNTVLSLHHYYKMMARYYLAQGDADRTLLYTDSVSLTTKEKDDHIEEVRAQALMMQGNGMEAAAIYQRLYHDKDSIFGRDARQHLDELNTLFKVDEIKTEQQRTKFLYTLMAASAIVLALLLLLVYGWRHAIRQKRVNEQLRLANRQALVASKMKSEFIRNISHEIRTPLNIVSGFTEILTSTDVKELPADEMADIQSRVAENTERITRLVDRMLELSDVSSEVVINRNDRMDVLLLAKMAIESSQVAQHTAPVNEGAAITFEFQHDDAPVQLLTNRLYAVRTLSHLLENALKFTSQGRITLRIETAADDVVRFVVEDTGIGIKAEEAEHIFEEFVQLDDFTEGTGIGLTVARSLARRMGGDLWLDTSYTAGSRFVFELLTE